MKILVFSDLHGSLNALKALMNTNDYITADKVIFLGDIVVGCSRPNECIELLKKLDCICLLGNNDSYIANHIPDADKAEFSNEKLSMIDWMNRNVSKRNKETINSWPKDFTININNKILYFTHYAWEHYNNDINVIDTPSIININTREKMFKNINADYIIFGHEHKTSYFYDDYKHYFCLGTLGLKNPGSYLLISTDNNEIKLEEKLIDFNINEEIEFMEKAGYPYEKQKIKAK